MAMRIPTVTDGLGTFYLNNSLMDGCIDLRITHVIDISLIFNPLFT